MNQRAETQRRGDSFKYPQSVVSFESDFLKCCPFVACNAVENPNLPKAIAFVILPAIVAAIGTMLLGFGLDLVQSIASIVYSLAAWIVLGIILYVIAFAIEGKSVKKKLSGILSALSWVWLVLAIIALLGFAFVATLPKELTNAIATIQKGDSSEESINAMLASLNAAAENLDTITMAFFAVATIILVLACLAIVFCVSRQLSKSLAKQIAIFIVFLAAWLVFSALTGAI